MDYGQIIRKSWDIINKNRWIWWLGLLAIWTEGAGGSGFNYNFGGGGTSPGTSPTPSPDSHTTTSLIDRIPRVLGATTKNNAFENFYHSVWLWMTSYWPILLIIIIVIIAIFLILLYVSYSAKAGLILSVNTLEEADQPMGFKAAFHAGMKYAWRLFWLNFVVGWAVFGIFVVIATPIALLLIASRSPVSIAVSIIYGILALLALVLISIYVGLILKLAERNMVLKDSTMGEAYSFGRNLFRKERWNVILTWLVDIGLRIAYGLGLMVVLIVVFIVLGVIGVAFYTISMAALIVYIVIAVLALLGSLMVLGGIFTAFMSSYWTLSYRAIHYLGNKKEK